jgi:hypothetical protein
LKEDRVDPSTINNWAIRRACEESYIANFEMVSDLLKDPRVDPSANESEALRTACRHHNIKLIKLLAEDGRTDPSTKRYMALRSVKNHPLATDALIEHPKLLNDPAVNIFVYMLAVARENEKLKKLLLNPLFDPSFCDNLPLRAITNLHYDRIKDYSETIKILSSVCPTQILKYLHCSEP